MPKSFPNRFKMAPKSVPKGVPEGSWSVPGPSREATWARNQFWHRFWLYFEVISGPSWFGFELKNQKKVRFRRVQQVTNLQTCFSRASSLDFSSILDVFWGCFLDVFWDRRILCVVSANVQNHCTFPTQPARHASFFYTDDF